MDLGLREHDVCLAYRELYFQSHGRLRAALFSAGVVDYPIVDEEYFEWIALLEAVAKADPKRGFVVAELGARNAPWTMRGLLAYQQLYPNGVPGRAVVLEPLDDHIKWIHQSIHLNHQEDKVKIVKGFFRGGVGALKNSVLNQMHVPELTLTKVLSDFEIVDYLDLDCQGGEGQIADAPADRDTLRRKVRFIHIETHNFYFNAKLRSALEDLGFTIQFDLPMTAKVSSPTYGTVIMRGGLLAGYNTHLVDV